MYFLLYLIILSGWNMSKRIRVGSMPKNAFRKLLSQQSMYFLGMGAITAVSWYFFSKNASMVNKSSSYGSLITTEAKKVHNSKVDMEKIAKQILDQNLKEVQKDYDMIPIDRPEAGSSNDSRIY